MDPGSDANDDIEGESIGDRIFFPLPQQPLAIPVPNQLQQPLDSTPVHAGALTSPLSRVPIDIVSSCCISKSGRL